MKKIGNASQRAAASGQAGPGAEAQREAGAALDAGLRGPSYPLATKWLATLLVAAVAAWFTRLWPELQALPWKPEALPFVAAVVGIIGTGWWIVLTGETSIDNRAIRHKALWTREVALADITGVKLVRIPGLDALIAPRLVVRRKGFGVTTFTAGNRQLLGAFRLIAHGPGPADRGDPDGR